MGIRRIQVRLLGLALLVSLTASCGGGGTVRRAEALLDDGRPTDAVRILESYANRNAGEREAQVVLGRAYLAAKRYEDARSRLSAALDRWPEEEGPVEWHSRVLREIALRSIEAGDADGARSLLGDAIADLDRRRRDGHPAPALLYQWMGNFHLLLFRSHDSEIQDLLSTSFESLELPALRTRLYAYVQAPEQLATQRESAFVQALQRNPAFGGIEAVRREMFAARREFRQTLAMLEQALATDPTQSTTARALATVYMQVNDLENARKMTEALFAIPAEGEDAEAIREDQLQGRFFLADILQRRGETPAALDELRKAIESETLPESRRREILERMCFLQAEHAVQDPDEFPPLRDTVERLLEIQPRNLVARVHQAILAFYVDGSRGSEEERRSAWLRTVTIMNGFPRLSGKQFALARETLARAHRELGNYGVAINVLDRLIDDEPDRTSARALRADTYRLMRYGTEALAECRALLEDVPGDTTVQSILRKVYEEQIHPADTGLDTIPELENQLSRERFDHAARYELVARLADIGRHDAAIEHAELLAEEFPENFVPRQLLATLHFRRGDLRSAFRHFGAVQRLAPELPDGHAGQARCRLREHALRDATDRFERALAIAPEHPELLLGLATCLVRRGDAKRARQYLEGNERLEIRSARELATEDQLLDLACLEQELACEEARSFPAAERDKALDGAIDELRAMTADHPRAARPRVGLVRCLAARGSSFDARELLFPDLEEVGLPRPVSLFEDDAIVLLFEHELGAGRVETALEILERFREGPVTVRGRLRARLAAARLRGGDLPAALALARLALRDLPDEPDAHRVVAAALADRGKTEALRHVNRVIAAVPGDEAAYRLQARMLAGRRSPQLLKAYQRLFKLAPEDLDTAQRIANLLERRGLASAANPQIAQYLGETLYSKKPKPFAERLLGLLLYPNDASEPMRQEILRFRVLSLYTIERLSRELGAFGRSRPTTPRVAEPKRVERDAGDATDPVEDPVARPARSAAPALLDREERRVLAALLLARGAPAEAFWTITRFDRDESSDDDFEEIDRVLLILALCEVGRLEDAAGIHAAARALWPDSPRLIALELALAVLRADFEAARAWIDDHVDAEERDTWRHLLRILEDGPGDPTIGLRLARVPVYREFPVLYADEVREATRLLQVLPASPVPYRLLAMALDRQGDTELAVRTLNESMERTPDHVPTILTAVEILIRDRGERSLAEAVRLLDQRLDFNPGSPRLLAARATLETRLERGLENPKPVLDLYREALAALEVEGRPEDPLAAEILGRMGKILLDSGSHELAEQRLAEAIRLDPGALELRSRRIEALLASKRFDAATSAAGALVEDFPADARAWLLLARAQLAANRLDEARTTVTSVLEMDPLAAEAYELRGRIEELREERRGAALWYERAVALDPGRWEILMRLAEGRLKMIERAEALDSEGLALERRRAFDELRQALATLPRQEVVPRVRALRGLLVLLELEEEWKEIVDLAGAHSKELARDARSLIAYGRALLELGRDEEADRTLLQAVELAPENPRARFFLGEVFLQRRAGGEALLEFQRALALEDDFPQRELAEERVRQLRARRSNR